MIMFNPSKMGRRKVFEDDDDNSTQNQGAVTFDIDEDFARRLEHNRKREDLQRYEELKRNGQIDDDNEEDDSEEESEPDDDIGDPKQNLKFFDALNKVKRQDPSLKNKDVKFFESDESDEEEKDGVDKKGKKEKKMYLKDVHGKHLIEEGPDYAEERIKTYSEQQEELRRAVSDAVDQNGGSESDDDDDLLRVKDKNEDDLEEDEELVKKVDEFFDEKEDENQKFMRNYFVKQLWKEKEVGTIDEAELDELSDDSISLWDQADYEHDYQFRHQEENAGDIVMGQSRKVEGSVRKKDTARKAQRKNKEDRMKIAEMERREELKQLKNVKKKEMKEKMKKVLSVAGFKEGEECKLDAKDLDDDFDPEEYDKMMKAAFDDNYYGAEDSGLSSDEDDNGEKPDFDKEDELLGLPKNWHVTQGGDGFTAAREKVLKDKENSVGDDEEEEEEEEEKDEGKRKRKRKTSLVQRAKEALMEEYYKLDYEDTIDDLKTRFKYAKVQPNSFQLETEEILSLDDTELNQYVPLKKMAPYVEKDWEVNKHKVKELKLKNKELSHKNEKRSKKKSKKSHDVDEKKPTVEEEEAETSKELSRKAKRRRRQAEKKLPPSRMAAYGKTQ